MSRVKGEWKNGQPHGLCTFESDYIKGAATFTDGKIHGGPMWIEMPDQKRTSYSFMKDGENIGQYKYYYQDNRETKINNYYEKQLTPGWAYFIGKSFENQHYLKTFDTEGNIK